MTEASPPEESVYRPGRHGDVDVEPGVVDFAVNVRGSAPDFVRAAIVDACAHLSSYPAAEHVDAAVAAICALHQRDQGEVMLLAGAADGFEMLPRLGSRHAALIQPSFTEPEIALSAAGIPITQVVLPPPWHIDPTDIGERIPADADLVVVGNPTNPTSVLHSRAALEAMRKPGRILVVDEAFADLTVDEASGDREPQSLASLRCDDVVVIRSVTKTFGLAGLRAGYLLAAPAIVEALSRGRRPWPLSTPALAALTECVGPAGQRFCDAAARTVIAERDFMVERLALAGVAVSTEPAAPFVLIETPNGLALKNALRAEGFGVRSCANFVGLGDDHVRLAVRDNATVDTMVDALTRVRKDLDDDPR
ncbi:Rv2231c family pyridoxal phosphate-dependent protein CobC [Gordonia aichiensis]|uniref:Rv2231c family pyridoxal phosphate-dependent protein CobC n=1 Tax=Gordonia aichiensis TaxID=36820 RepID=UPI00058EA82E|nr:Rv2231c family pyridoxal phosphate-dependent protein CobC [Gordonia aichiensis]